MDIWKDSTLCLDFLHDLTSIDDKIEIVGFSTNSTVRSNHRNRDLYRLILFFFMIIIIPGIFILFCRSRFVICDMLYSILHWNYIGNDFLLFWKRLLLFNFLVPDDNMRNYFAELTSICPICPMRLIRCSFFIDSSNLTNLFNLLLTNILFNFPICPICSICPMVQSSIFFVREINMSRIPPFLRNFCGREKIVNFVTWKLEFLRDKD